MKQELPNLVDERRFRRREPEQFERDEFGRYGLHMVLENNILFVADFNDSANGRKNAFLLTWS